MSPAPTNVYNIQCLEPQLSKAQRPAPNLEEIKDAPHLVGCEAYSMTKDEEEEDFIGDEDALLPPLLRPSTFSPPST